MTGRAISAHRAIPWLAMAIAAMLLAACTGTGPTGVAPGTPESARSVDSGPFKVGKPYQVAGQWYYPKVDLAYDERGVASWYGPNFHGKKTANGEIFDMTLISAAHKTLPLPSVVRVTNLENGRSLVIRINDRGPFVRGRIIDLSRRAAELLGFTNRGTAMVQVRLLPDESRQAALDAGAKGRDMVAFGPAPPKASPSIPVSVEALAPVEGVAVSMPAPRPASDITTPTVQARPQQPPAYQGARPPPYGAMTAVKRNSANPPSTATLAAEPVPVYAEQPAPINVAALPSREEVEQVPVAASPNIFIQAGAFREYTNANRLRARLTRLGHPVNVSQIYVSNQPFFRVRLGPLDTVEDADQALERVVALGYPDAHIVVD